MILREVFKNQSPPQKLITLVVLCLLCFSFFYFLSFVLAKPLFGVDLINNLDRMKDYSDPAVVSLLKFMQLMGIGLGLFLIPSILFTILVSDKPFRYLKANIPPKPAGIILVFLIMTAMLPFINFLIEINSKLVLPEFMSGIEEWMKKSEKSAEELTGTFLEMESITAFLYNLLLVGIMPAVGEELLFRGIIQKLVGKWSRNIHMGIWIAAFIFSFFHLQFYGFLPRLLLGAAFGYLFLWSGSIWVPIIAHFINNGSLIIIKYFSSDSNLEKQMDEVGSTEQTWLLVITNLLLTGMLMYLFHRMHSGKMNLE